MDSISDTLFQKSFAHVTETMSLDDTVDPIDYKVVTEESKIIIDSGITLTIGSGKTLIPNLHNHP
jgi:hypothetical protein